MAEKFLLALCFVLPFSVMAAGGGSDSSSSSSSSWTAESTYGKAKTMVDNGQFDAAIPVLFEAVREDGENADAYNLLGFTHRKTGKLDAALKYYNKALALEPWHRGAHEYIGEAYLELGDLASAKKHLTFLDEDCTFGCPEYRMLKEAVAKYEARQ